MQRPGQSPRVRLSFNQAAHRESGPTHLRSPAHLNLLLEEGADLLEGGSARRPQGPAGLHDAVSETGEEEAAQAWESSRTCADTYVYTHTHSLLPGRGPETESEVSLAQDSAKSLVRLSNLPVTLGKGAFVRMGLKVEKSSRMPFLPKLWHKGAPLLPAGRFKWLLGGGTEVG